MICLLTLGIITIYIVYLLLFLILNLKKRLSSSKISQKTNKKQIKIAFFHPFCNDGGGGQKVLWCIVKSLLNKQQKYQIAIYSLQPNKQIILQKASTRFDITFTQQQIQSLKIIHIQGKKLLQPKRFLTMVFHIILPMIYTIKCIWKYQPDIFYDTTGFAFNFFIIKLLIPTVKCFAYVHYPFISYDMIQKIQQRRQDYNNQSKISKSRFLTKLKIYYYRIILFLYRFVRFFAYYVQTNSSWTYNHIQLLWGSSLNNNQLVKLYPPCSVQKFLKFQKKIEKNVIMSLAQFRPQKNQVLQIQVFNTLLKNYKGLKQSEPILRICGTTRGQDDQKILENLKKRVKQLDLQKNIQFKVNMPYSGILQSLKQSTIGIHTMQSQHFGISVVQMMASGMLVVAHNSAGPKQDIIKDNKYLAISQKDYEQKLSNIINIMSIKQRQNISKQNRLKAQKFGQVYFTNDFLQGFQNAVNGFKNKQKD